MDAAAIYQRFVEQAPSALLVHRKQKPAKSKSPKDSHTTTARILDQRRIKRQERQR